MKSDLATRLKITMKEKDITQSELSRMTGITQSSISDWVRGAYIPKQDKIDIIAKALNVAPTYLMGWDDEEEIEQPEPELPEDIVVLARNAKNLSKEQLTLIKNLIDQFNKENEE